MTNKPSKPANLRQRLSAIPLIDSLCSIKLTVLCLFFLFFLTLWGTIDQVSNGLYLAQQKFFYSWSILLFNFLPVPGVQLIMWVLFINLALVALLRFEYTWSRAGLLMTHLGLMSFLVAAFATFKLCEEYHLTLLEQESSNVASAYHDWELSVWKESKDNTSREVTAYDSRNFHSEQILNFAEAGFSLVVKDYFSNCNAYTSSGAGGAQKLALISASGIQSLRKMTLQKEPEKNIPGGIFFLKRAEDVDSLVLLYGAETIPTPIKVGQETYFLRLRLKRIAMPFSIKLLDFRMELHPATEMARSYESEVEVQTPEMTRRTVISMNNPLRHKDYTFYQASYSIDSQGREASTIAVVKNSAQLLPYIASTLTFLGLLIHFGIMFVKYLKTKEGVV